MEKNFVDIKVSQPDIVYFYEIKSSAYASDCVREALGQILSYTHRDDDKRLKKLIILQDSMSLMMMMSVTSNL